MKKLLLISTFTLLALTAFSSRAEEGATLETLRQAATLGNDDAQLELGMLYEFGYNMAKNTVSAHAWYTVAAEHGNTIAAKRRDLLAGRLTPVELEESHRQSAEILASKSIPPTASVPAPAPATVPQPVPRIAPAAPTESPQAHAAP